LRLAEGIHDDYNSKRNTSDVFIYSSICRCDLIRLVRAPVLVVVGNEERNIKLVQQERSLEHPSDIDVLSASHDYRRNRIVKHGAKRC
jgi:hypothetical protein